MCLGTRLARTSIKTVKIIFLSASGMHVGGVVVNLSTRWRLFVNLPAALPLYPQEKPSTYLIEGLGRITSLTTTEIRAPDRSGRRLVAIPTELSRLAMSFVTSSTCRIVICNTQLGGTYTGDLICQVSASLSWIISKFIAYLIA